MPETPPEPHRWQARSPAEPGDGGESRRGRRLIGSGASLIFPGLGQLIQGRRLAGLLHALIAVAGLAVSLVPAADWYLSLLRRAVEADLAADEPLAAPFPWLPVLAGLALVLAIYVWSIHDAGRRQPSGLTGP